MIVECTNCAALVDGEVIDSYRLDDDDGRAEKYSFLRCPNCYTPFLVLQVNDNFVHMPEIWGEPQRLYPPLEISIDISVPNALRFIYEEACLCFRFKAYTATAVMCRKILQGIAKTKNINERDLLQSLQEMKKQEIIENRLYEWADALRLLGNEAAHDIDFRATKQDAKDVLDFTNALLEYVFVFQEKFEQFKKRQVSIKKTAA